MIITISGDPGSGKSTVAREVAKRLHYTHYSGGDMRGMLAREKGVTVDKINRLAEKDPSIDRELDERMARLGKEQDNLVIDTHIAWFFIPGAVKIYLVCDLDTGAQRVFKARTTEKDREDEPLYKSVADVKKALERRNASNRKRFLQYYGVDNTDRKYFDFVIDTCHLSMAQVTEQVLAFVKKLK
jgi:cytidylate kinase